jgi:hypothetical protein
MLNNLKVSTINIRLKKAYRKAKVLRERDCGEDLFFKNIFFAVSGFTTVR